MLECHNQEKALAQTLAVLVPAAVQGLVSDVMVFDKGSTDGSVQVADAAGCTFLTSWDLSQAIAAARGEWLLFLEPGARLQGGWIEELAEHMAIRRSAVRFSASSHDRRSIVRRFLRRNHVLEHGLLVRKDEALAMAKSGMDLKALAALIKPVRLSSQIIPASANLVAS